MTYRGWDILIESNRFGVTCWITSPSGEEYQVFVAHGNDRHQALSAARAMIDRITAADAAAIATLPYD